jgi:predicted  nucleic acid-binding Zn-ribbon protein
MSSSPLRPGASRDEELEYYKRQYEQLEADLTDFQASSKELEDQLEKDVDAAEKNERKLREQVERLNFEVDEWKGKHKQAKVEANSAQNALQKEITTIREQHRGLALKLRDIEVANDDYERQARNTTSSLEDLEQKLNVSIERGVLMEEEIKIGEREREGLRIETQRLRDELGDLKVESEIRLEKLRRAESTIESLRSRKPSTLAVESLRTRSPGSEMSAVTPTSPTASTPPPRSDSASDAPTPPSPPLSDVPANVKLEPNTPVPVKRRSFLPDAGATPRPSFHGARQLSSRHTRGTSLASGSSMAASDTKSVKPNWPRTSFQPTVMARSESLNQMKSLRSRMQKIEERVHSARSKLPPSQNTPRNSPRTAGGAFVPSSVTLRRTSKRPSAISTSITSNTGSEDSVPLSGRRESQVKRLSYGVPRPASTVPGERPPSSLASDRPSSTTSYNRPSSRISSARPGSRSGVETPLSANFRDIPAPTSNPASRSRSSMGGASYGTLHSSSGTTSPRKALHRSAQSISEHTWRQQPENEDTSVRRVSNLPAPGHARKRSMQMRPPPAMAPRPPSRKAVEAQEDDLGETY